MNAQRRQERQEQFRRIDAWLLDFRRNSPLLFGLFVLGISLFLVGALLSALNLLDLATR